MLSPPPNQTYFHFIDNSPQKQNTQNLNKYKYACLSKPQSKFQTFAGANSEHLI